MKSVVSAAGIDELNPVQTNAMPSIMAGKNVLIAAPTGSGKTEAAMIPVLTSYLKSRSEGI
ncbi:MAG: DEAD/DEAH box helicase, partial [Theionarchaea archaeon]|nr:DEAD/DEAH box helicase [Theionarchaea archaeon]